MLIVESEKAKENKNMYRKQPFSIHINKKM